MNTKTTNIMTDEELLTVNKEQNELLAIEEIEGTPFTAVRHEKDWYLCIGKYRLTEARTTLSEVIEESKDSSWFRMMAIMGVMVKESEEINELKEEVKKLKRELKLTLAQDTQI